MALPNTSDPTMSQDGVDSRTAADPLCSSYRKAYHGVPDLGSVSQSS